MSCSIIGVTEHGHEFYSYADSSKYELGAKKHKGHIFRTINKSFEGWVNEDFPSYLGKTGLVLSSASNRLGCDFKDVDECVRFLNKSLGEKSVDVIINKHLKEDIYSVDSIWMPIILVMHVAAFVKVDTVVFINIGKNLSDENRDKLIEIIKDISDIYDGYISNVFCLFE